MKNIDELKEVLCELIHPEKSYRWALSHSGMLEKLAKIINELNSEDDK